MAFNLPRVVFFPDETQRINNNLPQWHIGRRERTSNWARVVNSYFGQALADYKREEVRAFRNFFIQTAHLDEVDLIRVLQLPPGIDLSVPTENLNKLRNSGFFLRSRPDKVGDAWEHSGTVTVDSVALFGATSPALRPVSLGSAAVVQTVNTDAWPASSSRTISAWYRIESWAGGSVPSDSHGLMLDVTYADGTTQTFRSALDVHTSDQWKRVSLTVTPTKAVAEYDVRVATARSAAFDIDVPVRIDAFQVEIGGTAKSWQPSIFDRPNWFSTPLPPLFQLDADYPVFLTTTMADFYQHAVPTRAELYRIDQRTNEASRGGGIGRSTDFFKVRWSYTWDVDTTNNKVRKIGVNPQDIYALFDLAFFTQNDDGNVFETGVSGLTYRCVTLFGRWLWVVHDMVDLEGNTVTALSLCDPQVPYPSPTYLESKYTLTLPVTPGLDYHKLEVRFEDPQHLYLSTPTHEFVVRLQYDYGIADPDTFEVFLRESYDSIALVR